MDSSEAPKPWKVVMAFGSGESQIIENSGER
jgi:hypothetical protein